MNVTDACVGYEQHGYGDLDPERSIAGRWWSDEDEEIEEEKTFGKDFWGGYEYE